MMKKLIGLLLLFSISVSNANEIALSCDMGTNYERKYFFFLNKQNGSASLFFELDSNGRFGTYEMAKYHYSIHFPATEGARDVKAIINRITGKIEFNVENDIYSYGICKKTEVNINL